MLDRSASSHQRRLPLLIAAVLALGLLAVGATVFSVVRHDDHVATARTDLRALGCDVRRLKFDDYRGRGQVTLFVNQETLDEEVVRTRGGRYALAISQGGQWITLSAAETKVYCTSRP